jgi:hypothetical protein
MASIDSGNEHVKYVEYLERGGKVLGLIRSDQIRMYHLAQCEEEELVDNYI